MPYLFAHFKEKTTRDGEQVYFAVSKDGYFWQPVNDGRPVITCDKGCGGCRDIEIARLNDGGFAVVATDLCIVDLMDENCNVDWEHIRTHGSSKLSLWRSTDLVEWSRQELIDFSGYGFGCLWAPEIFFDEKSGDLILHWSSTSVADGYKRSRIYYSRTKDLKVFTPPEVLFCTEGGCIDSHIVMAEGVYHLFFKNCDPAVTMHAVSAELTGEYVIDGAFTEFACAMEHHGAYEAPTTFVLPDGKWCLLMDFFGCPKPQMGYVPFVSAKPGDTAFKRCDELFTFPYGFKHGGVVGITQEEYERMLLSSEFGVRSSEHE